MRRGPVLSLILLAACGAADPAATSVDAPPPGLELVFEREGVPGPWWRSGATQEMFETEHRLCLVRASDLGEEARGHGGDRADAAYRGFLACMRQMAWLRGLPPEPRTAAR